MDLSERPANADLINRHPWERARLEVVFKLLERTPSPRTILDVGCGDAWLLGEIAARGQAARHVGIDTALHSEREVRDGLELFRKIEDASLSPSEASHLLFLDVLEHVQDDVGLLRAYAEHPGVGGDATIIVTVPMHEILFVEHDRLLKHHRRYARAELLDVIRRANLEIVDDGALFTSLLFPRSVERIGEALRPSRRATSDIGAWSAGEGITKWISRTLVTDFRISERLRRQGVRLPGLSHFVIARRQ